MAYTGKPKVVNAQWVKELLEMESFTTKTVAELARAHGLPSRYGPDLINRLRLSPDLELEVLGLAGPPHHPHAKRFRLKLKEKV